MSIFSIVERKTDGHIAHIFRNQNSCHRLSLNVVFERVSIPSHENLLSHSPAMIGSETAYNQRDGQPRPPRGGSDTDARPSAEAGLSCRRCLDQPLTGSFGADVWQAMHGAAPGSKVSNEVCANCQITTTMLKMQSTKTRISSAVLPFSCERTSSL